MKQTEIEYAEALFILALEDNVTEEYAEHLRVINTLISENPDYLEVLFSPAIPLSDRLSAIDEAFSSMPENIVSFLKLLCENGHIRTVSLCIAEYERLLKQKLNTASANIFSAVELTEAQKQSVCKKLSDMTNKNREPRFILDPSLIGGIKIEIEGKTYDGSIKHRLHDIKDVITG